MVLLRNPKIPAGDTFIAARTKGPGLAVHTAYHVSAETAFVLFRIEFEKLVLGAFRLAAQREIIAPTKAMRELEENTFKPGGAQVADHVKQQILHAESVASTQLEREYAARLNQLPLPPRWEQSTVRVGMVAEQRDILMSIATNHITSELPTILQYYASGTSAAEEFYAEHDLPVDSVEELAKVSWRPLLPACTHTNPHTCTFSLSLRPPAPRTLSLVHHPALVPRGPPDTA